MFLNIITVLCVLLSVVYGISQHPILIVVSYDAFKYSLFDTGLVPHMNRLRKEGTYADYLINAFPTKTFPNHYTIATGLYPGVHGVVGNSYLDKNGKVVKIGYELFHYNEKIVPIWRHNEDLGEGRYSGTMMWPGAVFPYQGKNCTYSVDFDPSYDWNKRVDTVISWIKDPVKPANLIMMYIEEPDSHGHAFGLENQIVQDLIRKLDNTTHYLEQQLKVNGLTDKANVIHLSDHGMLSVKPPNFINLTQYLSPGTYTMEGPSPIMEFLPKKGLEQQVYNELKEGAKQNGHFKVYRRTDFLKRWHYDNPRSPDLMVMADVGYALEDLIVAAPKYAEKFNFTLTNSSEFGIHGYDYSEPSMHPFFMARGPKIKTNHKVPPFNSVDLYNLFAEILELSPDPNNGTLANVRDVLQKGNGKYSLAAILITTAGGILIAFVLLSCAAIITLAMIKRQQSITTTAALNKRFPQTFQTSIEARHLLEPDA